MIYPLVRRDLAALLAGTVGTALAGLVYVRSLQYTWLGVWTETGQAIRGSILLTGPLVLALGAYLGAAEERNGLRPVARTAPVSAFRRYRVPVYLTLAAALLGYVVPAGLALVRTAGEASYPGDALPFLAVTAAGLTAFATVGVALGSCIRWPLLPVAATVSAYFAIAYVSSTNSLDLLSPFDQRGVTNARFPAALLVQTLGWLLGLAAVAWCLLCRYRAAAVAVGLVTIAAGLPLLRQPPFPYDEDPASSALVCRRSTDSEICLTQVHEFLRGDVTDYVAAAREPLAGTPLAPDRFVEAVDRPGGSSPEDLRFATASSRLTGGATVTREAMLDQLSYLILDPAPCQTDTDADGYYRPRASDVVRAWYRTSLGLGFLPPGDPADTEATQRFQGAVDRFAALGAAERSALLTNKASKIKDCSLIPEELP